MTDELIAQLVSGAGRLALLFSARLTLKCCLHSATSLSTAGAAIDDSADQAGGEAAPRGAFAQK
jgi:hypothetical protein